MRVVALLQELLGLTSERMQVSQSLKLLCQRLSVSWACLTALSADGEVFQHLGAAYSLEYSKLATGASFSSCRTNSGLQYLSQGPGAGGAAGGPGKGPPSRTSSTNSLAAATTMEVGMSDPHLLRGSDTSIEAATVSGQPLYLSDPGLGMLVPTHTPPIHAAQAGPSWLRTTPPSPGHNGIPMPPPSMDAVRSFMSATPPSRPAPPPLQQQQQQQPQPDGVSGAGTGQSAPPAASGSNTAGAGAISRNTSTSASQTAEGVLPFAAWPLDWQLLFREKGLRAFACLPVTATNGSETVVGCLSFGSLEPLDWTKQFWYPSAKLITGWAAGAITTTRAIARASFYARLLGATDLDSLARAFAYDMPIFLADGAAGPGTALPEVRLALVSSRLQHSVVFAAPLLQVSGRLGLPPWVGAGSAEGRVLQATGGGGGGGGLAGAVIVSAASAYGLSGREARGDGMGVTGSGPSTSSSSMVGLVLLPATSSGTDPMLKSNQGGTSAAAASGGNGGGGSGGNGIVVGRKSGNDGSGGNGSNSPTGYETMECMVLGSAMDGEEMLLGESSSNSDARRGRLSSAAGSGRAFGSGANGGVGGRGIGPYRQPIENLPVECIKIGTDSTLLMSVLEAGDIMIIKDALQYFGGGRMVARDLALNNTRPATAGTLVILPLVHRCRSLGCVYVFARNEFNLSFSRAAWGDLAAMLSRAVFGQLVGKLRHEWYAVLSEDPQQAAAGRPSAPGDPRGRVQRTVTGNSIGPCSNASSLRPSFEVTNRSFEQPGMGGMGLSGGGGDAGVALAAAAAALTYAGFMLPTSDEPAIGGAAGAASAAAVLVPSTGGASSVAGPGAAAALEALAASTRESTGAAMDSLSTSARTSNSVGAAAAAALALPPRHRIPPAHASAGGAAAADGAEERQSQSPPMTSHSLLPSSATPGMMPPRDPCSPSPGSLSFKLPADVGPGALPISFTEALTATSEPATAQGGVGKAAAAAMPSSGVALPSMLLLPQQQRGALGSGGGGDAAGSLQLATQTSEVASGGGEAISGGGGSRPANNYHCGGGLPGGGLSGGGRAGRPRILDVLPADVAAANASVGAGSMSMEAALGAGYGPPDVGTDGEEDVSGSSRELQGWPELVDILYDMHRTRNVSVYLAAYRGRAVAMKMLRSHMSMDGRPGHLESEAMTIAAQQLLSGIRHPNILRVVMVYPLVYEVVASGGKGPGAAAAAAAARHGSGPPAASGSFNIHGGGGASGNHHSAAAQNGFFSQHGISSALGPLMQVQAHAMSDLLSGAAGTEVPSGGVYFTAVLPRREKFKRGLALMLELFPSVSLREALQKRMLLTVAAVAAPDGGGGGIAEALGLGNSQTALSDVGYPTTPTTSGAHQYHVSSAAAPSPHQPSAAFLQPHSFLPTLPEARSHEGGRGAGVASGPTLGTGAFPTTMDSSPQLAVTTGASVSNNSGNAGGSGTGIGGAAGSGTVHMSVLLTILSQITAGMAALHTAGMAHGELRPENILLALPPATSSAGCHAGNGLGRGGAGGCGGDGSTPRVTPPTPRGVTQSGANALSSNSCGGGSGGGGGFGGGGGVRGARVSYSSGRGGGMGVVQTERWTAERPLPGRPIGADVIVKIKDAGMTVVGFSKGAQSVRKLLQRNRSTVLPFLPPEVHRGERFGRSADVYMFGLLMWELYSGGVAFSNLTGTPIKLLQAVIADGVRPSWPDGTPGWYMSLASRCWASNPKQRPSFRRIADKLVEVASAATLTSAVAAAGWVGVSSFHG